jgi:hypothetical protein
MSRAGRDRVSEEDGFLKGMRDCVADLYIKGVDGGYDAKSEARSLIVLELWRLGLSQHQIVRLLHRWNRRCDQPWTQAECRRCIVQFVLKWLASKPEVYRLSCNGNSLRPVCFRGERFCRFFDRQRQTGNAARAEGVAELSRFSSVWDPWLRAHHANGSNICTVWRVLVQWVVEYDLSYNDPIYISLRKIAELAAEAGRPLTSKSETTSNAAMAAYRAIRGLEAYGLIRRVQQGEGKRPTSRLRRKSNGYRLVFPLPPPPEPADGQAASPGGTDQG